MRRAQCAPQVPEGMQDDEVDGDVYGVKIKIGLLVKYVP
jgi:hypothetical protein